MIYEYGVGMIPVDLEKAKEYYSRIKGKKMSAKRNFLLCYLYCVKDINVYFEETRGKYTDVNILFGLANILAGEPCHHDIDKESCSLAKRLANSFSGQDVYYEAGTLLYEEAKRRQRQTRQPYKFLEMPYYFIMKSYVEGNEQALDYLSTLPRHQSWAPVVTNRNQVR